MKGKKYKGATQQLLLLYLKMTSKKPLMTPANLYIIINSLAF
jgi:hypothetical protein